MVRFELSLERLKEGRQVWKSILGKEEISISLEAEEGRVFCEKGFRLGYRSV